MQSESAQGYDSIGYELSKPALRAKMEADMVAISRGTRERADVVRDAIDMYRQVFRRVAAEANKLDASVARYFSDAPPPAVLGEQAAFSRCACGGAMALRSVAAAGAREPSRLLHCGACGAEHNLPRRCVRLCRAPSLSQRRRRAANTEPTFS